MKGLRPRLAALRRRLAAWWRRLLAEHASPRRLAAAVFVGAIVGCTPLFGFHLPICLGLAYLLKLNKVTVYAAANVSIPPLVPFIAVGSIEAGHRLLWGRWLGLSLAEVRHQAPEVVAARFLADWLVGALVLGAALGAALATVVYAVAERRRRMAADPERRALVLASRRYRRAAPSLRRYVWFKIRLDPGYHLIARLVPENTLTVDLGTGLGTLPLLLALLPGGRHAIGVEWDARKLEAARLACEGLDSIALVEADVRAYAIPACDAVCLVDVLHYYSPEAQRRLLGDAARALRPGGRLLIREGDARAARGARWTRLLEAIAVRMGWNRGEGTTRFRPLADLLADLQALDLEVTTHAASGRLHPGNLLVEARRPAATEADLIT